MNPVLKREHVEELLLQALETEMGGVQIYTQAIECAVNKDLHKEWKKYLKQTEEHVEAVRSVCKAWDLDPDKETPGRQVVRHIGASLVKAMTEARRKGDPAGAQLVATECVALAETKDHANWNLLGEVLKHVKGDQATALRKAHDKIEDEEDEHLYHTTGWSRELWLEFLGIAAVLPPPEEEKDVKTAIGAARARSARTKMPQIRKANAAEAAKARKSHATKAHAKPRKAPAPKARRAAAAAG